MTVERRLRLIARALVTVTVLLGVSANANFSGQPASSKGGPEGPPLQRRGHSIPR